MKNDKLNEMYVHNPCCFFTVGSTYPKPRPFLLPFEETSNLKPAAQFKPCPRNGDDTLPMAPLLSLATTLPFIFFALLTLLTASLHTHRQKRRSQNHAFVSQLETPSEAAPASSAGGEDAEKERAEDGRRKKKKRGRKKRRGSGLVGGGGGGDAVACCVGEVGGVEFAYPFSPCASAAQRRIKMQYDQLVVANQAKRLSTAQLGQFVSCLVDARDELQHKSEIIQRSFKIKRALLFKADKSSFDRLCQQVYKLEAEHKRIEEDAAVYNLLQEQLKLSPAYKTLLELGASTTPKDAMEEAAEISDISFEELLAQEKKDSFWQRNGKLRSAAD